jgi:RNA polymerase-binding protein DksA
MAERSRERKQEETMEQARERLQRERKDAIEKLRALGVSPESDGAPRGPAEAVLDEGDQAQASERQDIGVITRERIANRINRLTAALQQIDEGTYGICSVCGGPIEPSRLAALPEADTCLGCQERREQSRATDTAA